MKAIDKEHLAMYRAAVDVAEERMREQLDKLADEVRPGSQRVTLGIPASTVNNHVDTQPIADAISSILASIRDQPIATSSIDTAPIAEAIRAMFSIVERQPVPQVNLDMGPIAAALSNGSQEVVRLIEAQNDKIAVLSDAIGKLLKILADQKPIQFQPQITAESPSMVALVKDQREFFAKMTAMMVDKPKKRRIRIEHTENESVVTEE